jgi:hypothetical protein
MISVWWTGFELVRLPQSSVGREQHLNQHHELIIEAEPPALDKATGLTDRDVARRAFEIFCERGCEHGHDLDDWLQAEREVRGSVETAVA